MLKPAASVGYLYHLVAAVRRIFTAARVSDEACRISSFSTPVVHRSFGRRKFDIALLVSCMTVVDRMPHFS
jgi:hypothetical protein